MNSTCNEMHQLSGHDGPEILAFEPPLPDDAEPEPFETEAQPALTHVGHPDVHDYPLPDVLVNRRDLDWIDEDERDVSIAALGHALAETGDLYRNPAYAGGLVLASPSSRVPVVSITDAGTLAAIISDRHRVRVMKKGKIQGQEIPAKLLKTMLRSEVFLQQFRPVDYVDRASRYLPDFSLTHTGYNDGGYGQRILHSGDEPWVEAEPVAINKFLDVMTFASDADRTNALAAALTVLLRNHWPGAKPCLVVTASKSHAGKDTVVLFAAGTTHSDSISYDATDWAFQKIFIATLKCDPEIGLINVENARLERGQREIRSAFLERILTDPAPLLHAIGTGKPVRRCNDVVVAITTNYGTVSEDLLNRALPIHLTSSGDVANRVTPIGNPKREFLPANRDRIVAELRGMVERWKDAGRPLDEDVRHPFGSWAKTVGGILKVNGFAAFLANYGHRKTADDPVRRGLGLIGAARPNQWLRSGDWAAVVLSLGLVRDVVPASDRDSNAGHGRGLGVVLSAHHDETFAVETEDEKLVLRLEKARRRFEAGGEAQTRYRFEVLERAALPADDDPQTVE
jgi:hypothetical protein